MTLSQRRQRTRTAVHLCGALLCAAALLIAARPAHADEPAAAVTQSKWRGFDRDHFKIADRDGFVTRPAVAAPGGPWVWRTSFPDFHADADVQLLDCGYHVAYLNVLHLLGSDKALDLMDRFYDHVTRGYGLSKRPALEAVSRGGLHAYRYAARHPRRVACIYADTPVMDFKSWPYDRRQGKSARDWKYVLEHYGFASDDEALAYRGNPVDSLAPIAEHRIPLRHVISSNDAIVPPEHNTLLAQKRLEALGHAMEVVTVVGTRFQGHHFPMPAVADTVRFIMRHTAELPGGPPADPYINLRSGLHHSRAKFLRDRTGRVAFLGGSITQNPGWRQQVVSALQQWYPDTKFEFVEAGISSLGSLAHAFRLKRDVLARGPIDLLFVEAAVNDTTNGKTPLTILRSMEGIVRHVRRASPSVDVVHMHFAMPSHLTDYRAGRVPTMIAVHERVAEHYGSATLNLAHEVADRIDAQQFTWDGDFKDLHPSPYGQQVYSLAILRLLDAAWRGPAAEPKPRALPEPIDPNSYDRGRFASVSDAQIIGGFVVTENWSPRDKRPGRPGFVNVPVLEATSPGDAFEFRFVGRAVGLFVNAGPDTGVIEYRVDDQPWRTLDTFSRWSQDLHLPWSLMLADALPDAEHTLHVRLTAERNSQSEGTALRVVHFLVD